MDNKLKFPSWADFKTRQRSSSRMLIPTNAWLMSGLLLAGGFITGCSSIVTDKMAPSSGSPIAAPGLSYFLPKGYIHVTGNFGKTNDPNSYVVAASATLLPDPSTGPYFAHRAADYFSNDSMHLATTNGLLNSASATNNDATAQIVAAAAAMVKPMILGIAPHAGPLVAFDITFDPAHKAGAIKQVKTDCGLDLRVRPIGNDPQSPRPFTARAKGFFIGRSRPTK
jgi:hypothetical protein